MMFYVKQVLDILLYYKKKESHGGSGSLFNLKQYYWKSYTRNLL